MGSVDINFDTFLKMTKSSTVPESYYLANLVEVEKLCEQLINVEEHFDGLQLEEVVVKNLTSVIVPGVQISVMASGGADSTFLLSVIAKTFPNNELLAYFGKTASNAPEFEAVRVLCREIGAKVNIVIPTVDNLEDQLGFFHDVEGRYPRDIAQPLHNFLISKIRADNPSAVIVDGQYADTLMFANPQNMFFNWWNLTANNLFVRWVVKALGTRNIATLSSGQTKLSDLFATVFADKASLIAWLCRLDPSLAVKESVDKLLNKYPAEVVMQVVFYKVLLDFREADKYILCPEVVSPFHDITLMINSWRDPQSYNSLLMRKKPIWNYIKCNHPGVAKLVKRRSFEPI